MGSYLNFDGEGGPWTRFAFCSPGASHREQNWAPPPGSSSLLFFSSFLLRKHRWGGTGSFCDLHLLFNLILGGHTMYQSS